MSDAAGDHRVFPPPEVPVESFCLHCGRVYMSNLMLPIEMDGETHYCCPAEGCTAMGWEFDIFPVNEEDSINGQWVDDEDDDSDDDEEFEPITEIDADLPSLDESLAPSDSFEPPREWTPDSDDDEDDEQTPAEDIDSHRFTQEDYDRLKQTGEIDRRIAEIRQRWLDSAKEREELEKTLPTGDEKTGGDEEIPL